MSIGGLTAMSAFTLERVAVAALMLGAAETFILGIAGKCYNLHVKVGINNVFGADTKSSSSNFP